MPTAADRRAYRGPALFSFGFRPFFLFGATWAALAVPLWLWAYAGSGPALGVDRDWHVHEMLFGYLAAVVAGFLLTAVPNWTGRMPVMGAPLAALFGLWVLGRLAMISPWRGEPWAMALDSLFLVAFAVLIWREVVAGRNSRNLPVCLIVTLLAVANIAFHLSPYARGAPERAALGAAAALIGLIGGRVVPSFTRNWLAPQGLGDQVAVSPRLDQVSLYVTGLAGAAWVIWPGEIAAGGLLVAAGLVAAVRLARWGGWRTRAEPLVWILHLGYGWLTAALVLLGFAVLAPQWIPRTAGVHALTAGAIGVMTLAMMTRASLGHTGRARVAGPATLTIYLLVNVAAVLRVAAAFAGAWRTVGLEVSGGLWVSAFALFAIAYGPALTRPARPQA